MCLVTNWRRTHSKHAKGECCTPSVNLALPTHKGEITALVRPSAELAVHLHHQVSYLLQKVLQRQELWSSPPCPFSGHQDTSKQASARAQRIPKTKVDSWMVFCLTTENRVLVGIAETTDIGTMVRKQNMVYMLTC